MKRQKVLKIRTSPAFSVPGRDPTAEMNLIRQRAYGVNFPGYEFIIGTKEQNDAAILQERLFETAFEGT